MPDITKAEKEARKALFAEGLKRCSKCLEALPIDRFQSNSRGWMGLRSRCRDCENAITLEYQRQHPEKVAERVRRWQIENPERSKAITQRYRDNRPLVDRLRRGRHRAQLAGVPYEHITTEELLADWQRRGISPDHDVYTGQPLQEGWHLDHAVPLSAPGTPGHIVSNLVPTNRSSNNTKGRKNWLDYIADREEQENAA
ncbi:hypothetical protein C8E05_1576 [Rhodococcus wratislaviensis]|uniref:HNH endonuclease n=1 Tax=Rhodococcus wratislaviensis TaxID=44752 RepID=A0AB38FH47_RHOWR|nr:hypothetical protein [Rhodococcus wratislaviensis]REE72188.1 hypothetical protein C8E05_1576 [Rhodococcus wratislaviensis]SPZ40796.1 Uncharacterised protein [Rhodococcus wratislaviensis]